MSGIGAIVETAIDVDDVETAEVFYDLLPVAPRYEIEVRPPEQG